MLNDIQLVALPSSQDFMPEKDPLPSRGSVVIYASYWVSETTKDVVFYIGSHKVSRLQRYYGSGLQIRAHIRKHGSQNVAWKILRVLSSDELVSRWEIETQYILEYKKAYGSLCRNISYRAGGGRQPWTKGSYIKYRQTSRRHFDTDHPFQAEEVKQKIKETNRQNLGVAYPMQSKNVRNKSKATIQEKYNVDNISQVHSIKEQKAATAQQTMGKSVKKHLLDQNQSYCKEYGVVNISQIEEVRQRKREKIQQRRLSGKQTKQTKPVVQVDAEGNTLQEFGSASAAAYATFPKNPQSAKVMIGNVCKKKYAQYRNTYWRFA